MNSSKYLAVLITCVILRIFSFFYPFEFTQAANIEEDIELIVQKGLTSDPSDMQFSPDGKLLATGDTDNAKLWSVETGELIRVFNGHSENVFSVAFSPDGKLLATGSNDKTVKLWDVKTGVLIRTLKDYNGHVYHVSFCPDSNIIGATGSENIIYLWSVSTGTLIQEFRYGDFEFSSDSTMLAAITLEQEIRVWDIQTGKLIKKIPDNDDFQFVYNVTFSSENELLISATQDEYHIVITNDDNDIISELEGEHYCTYPSNYNLNRKLLSDSIQNAEVEYTGSMVWDVMTGEVLYHLEGNGLQAFSPDGSILATEYCQNIENSQCRELPRIALWSMEDGQLIRLLDIGDYPTNELGFDADENKLIWEQDNFDVWTLNLSTNSIVRLTDDTIREIACKDGRILKLPSCKSNLFGACINNENEIFIKDKRTEYKDMSCLALSADLTTAAFSDKETDTVIVWDIQESGLLNIMKSRSMVTSASLSPDGKLLAVGKSSMADSECYEDMCDSIDAFGETAIIWDLDTGKIVQKYYGDKHVVEAVAFSLDGEMLLTGGWDGVLKLWDIKSGDLLNTFSKHHDFVTSVAFSGDGKKIVSASNDNSIIIWDVNTGKIIKTLNGHASDITRIIIDDNRNLLYSAGDDSTVRFWDINSGENIATIYPFKNYNWVVATADGRFDCSGCEKNDPEGGMQYLRWRQGVSVFYSEDLFNKYYTPGLLLSLLNE